MDATNYYSYTKKLMELQEQKAKLTEEMNKLKLKNKLNSILKQSRALKVLVNELIKSCSYIQENHKQIPQEINEFISMENVQIFKNLICNSLEMLSKDFLLSKRSLPDVKQFEHLLLEMVSLKQETYKDQSDFLESILEIINSENSIIPHDNETVRSPSTENANFSNVVLCASTPK